MKGVGAVLRAELPPDPAAVRVALVHLAAELVRTGLPENAAATVELVLAEVLNNVVEHAFAPGESGRIAVILRPAARHVTCEVQDDGRAMPGGELPDGRCPGVAGDRHGLAEGGYGWFLIRTLAEGLAYHRGAVGNRLRFRVPVMVQ